MFESVSSHFNKKNIKRNLVVGGAVAVGAGVYILHRGRINAIIEMHQDAINETMWSSFDEGVKYGLALAKDPSIAGFGAKEIGQYAFGAFDKTA